MQALTDAWPADGDAAPLPALLRQRANSDETQQLAADNDSDVTAAVALPAFRAAVVAAAAAAAAAATQAAMSAAAAAAQAAPPPTGLSTAVAVARDAVKARSLFTGTDLQGPALVAAWNAFAHDMARILREVPTAVATTLLEGRLGEQPAAQWGLCLGTASPNAPLATLIERMRKGYEGVNFVDAFDVLGTVRQADGEPFRLYAYYRNRVTANKIFHFIHSFFSHFFSILTR